MLHIDDYPHGNRETYKQKSPRKWRKIVVKALAPFESLGVEYLLGVSPLLLEEEDIKFLNDTLHSGWAVMHGFDHYWSYGGPWSDIRTLWESGGEFCGREVLELSKKYYQCHDILLNVKRYNPAHFIPPFNAVNQSLLSALQYTPVRFLHGLDLCYKELEQAKLWTGQLHWCLSEWQKTYAHVDVILQHHLESPITLHWIYDSDRPDWELHYLLLAKRLAGER